MQGSRGNARPMRRRASEARPGVQMRLEVLEDRTCPSGAVTSLALIGMPSTIIADTATDVTVMAEDSAGNTVQSYTGTVHFSSTDVQAGLPAEQYVTER